MIGIFTFGLGFFRLGFLDSVLSRALLRGFILAVAAIVMIEMSSSILGLDPAIGQCLEFGLSQNLNPPTVTDSESYVGQSPFMNLIDIIRKLGNAHLLTTIVSIFSISFLVGMKQIKIHYKRMKWVQLMPEILVLVVVTTFFTWLFRWGDCLINF
jgi:MFS superfamily sulfate permease-like transporter